jgi:sodium/pantothenate symporter
MTSEQIEIIVVLVIYFGICIGLGLWSLKRSRKASTHEFLTAGSSVGWLVNAVCIFAAFNSGGALMGNFGIAYDAGWGFMCTMCAGTATGMFISSILVAGPLRNLRIATVPEFLRKRYDLKILNILVPIILIATITGYLMAQMKVAGMMGEKILGLPYVWGVLIIAAVYIFYTAIGGMFSVTLTDCFQGWVMLFVLTLACIFAVHGTGGISEVYSKAAELRPQFIVNNTPKYPWISFLGGFMGWMFVNSCLPHSIMRVFTAKNERTARMSLALGALLIGGFAVIANILIPAAGVVIHGGADLGAASDYLFMDVIDNYFPGWFKAVTYAGVFAAVMSSVSGMLLSIGSAVSYDLIQTCRPNTDEKTVRKLSMWAIVIFGVISALLALNPPKLLTILYASAMGVLASGVAGPLVLGLWWKRMNKYGALAGLIGGAGTWVGLFLGTSMPPLAQSAFAIPLSFILCIVVSLITPPSTEAEMHRIVIAHQRELTAEEM